MEDSKGNRWMIGAPHVSQEQHRLRRRRRLRNHVGSSSSLIAVFLLWTHLFQEDAGRHVLCRTISAFAVAPQLRQPVSNESKTTTTTSLFLLKPAMEHSQPFWGGTPDPYLTAGKSIAPSARALTDLGIVAVDKSNSLGTTLPVLDASQLIPEAVLPGFAPTGSFLSSPIVPYESSATTFGLQLQWATDFLPVLDALPQVVFAYALVEFFILRPNLDVYLEDIQANPGRAWTDAVAVTSVRLAMFAVVAAVTTTVFG